MKKLVFFALGLVMLLLAATLAGPSFVDWNGYKPEITRAVEERIGRKLIINGSIDIQILPYPRLSVSDARLSNLEGAADPDLARLDSLQVRIAVQPLLRGVVRISSFTLIRPVISLERMANGRVTWEFDKSGIPGSRPGEVNGVTAEPVGRATISLDAAKIVGGRVIYRDAFTGANHEIRNLDATVSATSLSGPYSAAAKFSYKELKAEGSAKLGAIDARGAAALVARLVFPNSGATANFEGTIDLDARPSVFGKALFEAGDVTKVAGALQHAMGIKVAIPEGFAKPLSGTARISVEPDKVTVDDFVAMIGETRLHGVILARLKETLEIDANLSLGRLDLDQLDLGSAKMETSPQGTALGPRSPSGPQEPFELPDNIRANLVFSADAFGFKGRTIRQIKLEAVLDKGVVDVSLATAQLPGGTDITVTGALQAGAAAPRFAGRADLVSDNLRTALEWIGAPLDGLSADRLRKGTLSADLDISKTQLKLTNWSMMIDGTAVAGGLTLLIRDRPAFGLRLFVDKINVDAYLPVDMARKQQVPGSFKDDFSEVQSVEIITQLLTSFDANVILEVAEARFRETLFRGALLDATVQSGKITIKDFTIKDVVGASVSMSGELAGTLLEPSAELDLQIEARSASRMAKLEGLQMTGALDRLGGFRLTSKVMGSLDVLTLNTQLAIAGGKAVVKGQVKPLKKPPGLDLAI